MKGDRPSTTAYRVAMRRAAHQVLDVPPVFEDPLALRIVGEEYPLTPADPLQAETTPLSRRLRAFLAARSRFAEEALAAAIRGGVRQYVILGAGLDTFAYRYSDPAAVLRVFEVDHPSTQAWKRARLGQAGIAIPESLTFVPLDFATQSLADGLTQAGFDRSRRAFSSWLGVTPYLTAEDVMSTLRFVAALEPGSGVVFDYALSPSLLTPSQRWAHDQLAVRVATVGEPWRSSFEPSALAASLRAMGFGSTEDIGPEELNARYFANRTDDLQVGGLARLMLASRDHG